MNTVLNNFSTNVDNILVTDGSGYWSDVSKAVRITKLELITDSDLEFGELRVYFDTNTWDVDNDGLIYSDNMFIHDLRVLLVRMKLAGTDVGYSEQGMQGDDYVSLDAGPKFIQSWNSELFV